MTREWRKLVAMAGRLRSSRVRGTCIALMLFALGRHAAQGQIVTEFSVVGGSWPVSITAGPDGALWFVEQGLSRIGRITPLGVVTEFSSGISPSSSPAGITTGSDGNLWFTEAATNRIGRITPLGVVTEFAAGLTPSASLTGIAAGPDGNLWFLEASANKVGRITPTGVVTEFAGGITPTAFLTQITAGPDGNLWFTEQNADKIGRITPAGVVTEFGAGISPLAQPLGIAAGPDGNLWFTEVNGSRIGRITPAGVVTEFSVGITPAAQPLGIAAGADGNLWFVESALDRIGRITPAGVVTEFPAFAAGPTSTELAGVTLGPDGNVWFTSIARLGLVGDGIARITTGPDVGTTFHPTPPCRVLDTRDAPSPLGGPALAAGATRDFIVTGACGIPAGAVSISANVTITQAASTGTLFTLPAGLPVLGLRPGLTRANNAFLRLARDGTGVLSFTNDLPSGTVQVVVDVNGWWQ